MERMEAMEGMEAEVEVAGGGEAKWPQYREAPEPEALAKKWNERIASARQFWKPFHKRIRHNRKLVSGFDWEKEPDANDFYTLRANLIHSTIVAILPQIYARNPEISVKPQNPSRDLKLLCKTVETVTNRYLEAAHLKQRAKATVRAALTCSYGVLKVMYERDPRSDPIVQSKWQDGQDNLIHAEKLMMDMNDPSSGTEGDGREAELKETLGALEEKTEVQEAEGFVIDRILTEQLLIDPTVTEFWDYEKADWMAQIVPMKKAVAEGLYRVKLDRATLYHGDIDGKRESGRVFAGTKRDDGEAQVCLLEIWDRQTQRVYTMAEGCDFWLREPYSPPKLGERWYPFFLLPFQTVDGCFVGPSIVDLTERLQGEHNMARDRYNEHRDLIRPGYIASSDVSQKTLKRFSDSELGEITLIDSDGQPIQQVIIPKQHPPFDPSAYDVQNVRYDWEQVTGLQDAVRSTIVSPKTATEANIMQQSLSGRVSEFRDQIEDFLQQLAQYTAQVLLQEVSPEKVAKIMGDHKTGPVGVLPTGEPVMGVIEPAYDWPQLTKEEVFSLVQLTIRAGTTGQPDKTEQQEVWIKMLSVVQPLVERIMQLQMQGVNADVLVTLLKETVGRFDDRINVDDFIPRLKPPQQGLPVPAGQTGPEGGRQVPQPGMPPVSPEGMPQGTEPEGSPVPQAGLDGMPPGGAPVSGPGMPPGTIPGL